MKKHKFIYGLFILISLLFTNQLFAQLPDGSISPDFTLTDLNGNSHNLYSLLDSNYTVIINFDATWNPPGWNFHQTNTLEDVWQNHGPNGDNTARVFLIDVDNTTTNTDLLGIGPTTLGDWTSGQNYPIINASLDYTFQGLNPYNIFAIPTIIKICPDKTIEAIGQISASDMSAEIAECSPISDMGCTDPNACNFNPLATTDDGSCDFGLDPNFCPNPCTDIAGCASANAINYNPLATCNDGSCIFPILGCTDPSDCNYNPLANTDDGSCFNAITTNDLNPPVVDCPAQQSLSSSSNFCGSVFNYDLNITDECNFTVNQISGLASGEVFPLGLTNNIIVIEDLNGNTTTCAFDVYVFDVDLPSINCIDDTSIFVNSSCLGIMPDFSSSIINEENCLALQSIMQDPAPGTTLSNGTNPVALTAIYEDGSSSECIFDVNLSITGNSNVTANCQDTNIYLDANGEATLTSNQINNGSFGYCSLSYGISQSLFNCNHIGENQIELIVQDGSIGLNQATCISNVTVIDSLNPICDVQDISINIDAFGDASIWIEDINLNSTDNCGYSILGLSDCVFYCSDVGTTKQTSLLISDYAGNTSNCIANVSILDDANNCLNALCGDGLLNGDEQGIDCGGTFCAPCTTCLPSISFFNEPILQGTYEQSNYAITTNGNVNVENGNESILRAANFVEMNSGFSTNEGSILFVLIGPCN